MVVKTPPYKGGFDLTTGLTTEPKKRNGGILTKNDLDRRRYATFPPAIKTAMKTAADHWLWGPDTWRLQTALIGDALDTGADPERLAAAYAEKPQG